MMSAEFFYGVVVPVAGLGGAALFLCELGQCFARRSRAHAKPVVIFGSLLAALTAAASAPGANLDPTGVAALFFAGYFAWAPLLALLERYARHRPGIGAH